MKAFIDTNVVVDFCAMREPFFKDAATIMEMARQNALKIVISSLTFVNVAYIMHKYFPIKDVMIKLQSLMVLCDISPIDKDVISKAILDNSYDFEDAVQYFSTNGYDIDIIITRDKRGFKEFPIVVNTPHEFIANCQG